MLITLSTTRLWSLLLFSIHQVRAKGRPADGLFRQQQALLRAAPSPASLLADWTKLWWVWRKRTRNSARRSLLHILIALVFTTVTIVAGLFSSYIVRTSNLEVLVSGSRCGPILAKVSGNAVYNYLAKVGARGDAFAQNCYQYSTPLPAQCQVFVTPNIPLQVQPSECPYGEKICLDTKYSGVTVDSGLVDATRVFGWNHGPNDLVKYRRKATCGILKVDGYQSIHLAKDLFPVGSDRPYFPGEQAVAGWYEDRPDFSFFVSLITSNVTRGFSSLQLQWFATPELNEKSGYMIPLPGMNKTDADLSLVVIAKNNVKYIHPVDDPVFAAHKAFNHTQVSHLGSHIAYSSDWPNAVLGCSQQHQFCIKRRNRPDFCSPLSSLPADITTDNFPEASDIQIESLFRILNAGVTLHTGMASTRALQANRLAISGIASIESLPEDHWMQEVLAWEKFIWASLQITVSDYAIGYGNIEPTAETRFGTNLTEGEQQLCNAQKMVKSGGFANINVFGLVFVITFATVATLLDLVLLKFLIFLGGFRRALVPRIDRWIQDGVLQLQRRAFESNNEGVWERLDKEVPATIVEHLLYDLPLKTGHSGRTYGSQRNENDNEKNDTEHLEAVACEPMRVHRNNSDERPWEEEAALRSASRKSVSTDVESPGIVQVQPTFCHDAS